MKTNKKLGTRRFMSWRDLILTSLVFDVLLIVPGVATWFFYRAFHFSFFVNCVFYYGLLVVLTISLMKILRQCHPLDPGIYSSDSAPWDVYLWNLQAFLTITILHPFTNMLIVPPPFRSLFYRLLGGQFGSGIIPISAKIHDPFLVEVEENTMLGDDALLLPHAIVTGADQLLILGKITVKKGAVVGARSIILPNVIIGENSTINVNSVVPMNTVIPANEIWGGQPAKKIGDVPREELPSSDSLRTKQNQHASPSPESRS